MIPFIIGLFIGAVVTFMVIALCAINEDEKKVK